MPSRVTPLTVGLFLILAAAPSGALGQAQTVPVCGDVNTDGVANVQDALTIARGRELICAPPALPIATTSDPFFTSRVRGDDGDVRAGLPSRYVDNRDGTISDLNTGLMWEKKVQCDSVRDTENLQDGDLRYPWAGSCSITTPGVCGTDADCPAGETCDAGDFQTPSPDGLTIFEWVEELNNVSFAGYTDWRIPNVKELQSIVDYGNHFQGAADPAFASPAMSCPDLADPNCSCLRGDYWSSTGTPFAQAWAIDFFDGSVNAMGPGNHLWVRAVRGGL